MNDLDLCLEVLSTIALHSTLNISETVRLGSKKTTNRKWPTGNQIITWPNRWCHVTLKGQTRDPNTLRAQYRKQFSNCRKAVRSAIL